jgi:tetratricopeptide (TPR) repeat protein
VRQFEEALGAAPDDARLRSDLGAALLEQAKVNRLKGDLGRSGVELGRSLEALTQALTLDPALSEALFNRALCKQQMGLESEAAADWKEYLAKDSRSEWAAEARQNLAQIEERKKRALLDQNSLFENFLSAYDSRDGDRAWETFRRARARTGNRIAERLIDGFLESAARTQQAESARLLPPLAYAGELEFQKTGDRFTLDLAAYYGDSSPKQLEVVARARGLMKLAADRYNQSEMEAALDLYAKARDEFRRAGDECEGTFAEGWVSYCQVRLGDSAACLALCERLVRLYERKGYKSLLAHALNTMADAYTGQDELSQAIEYAGRSDVVYFFRTGAAR